MAVLSDRRGNPFDGSGRVMLGLISTTSMVAASKYGLGRSFTRLLALS